MDTARKEALSLHARRSFLTGVGSAALAGVGAAAAAGVGSAALFSTRAAATEPPEAEASETIPVARVTDFPSIAAAADSLTAGGILYFPEGVHHFTEPVSLRPKTWVLGAGAGSVLVRRGAAEACFLCSDATGVRLSNLAFDVCHENHGNSAVKLLGQSDDITVEQCVFYSSIVVPVGQTAYALYIEGAARSHIRENVVLGLDMLAGTRSSGPGLTVQSNHLVRAPRVALAILGTAADQEISSVVIEDNLIEDARSGGIVIGAHIEPLLLESIAGVIVRGNTVTGALPSVGSGILVRQAHSTTDVLLDGNVVSDSGSGPPSANSLGILVSGDTQGATFKGVVVRGNSVRGVDQSGIVVVGSGSGVLLTGNSVDKTRGVAVVARWGPLSDVILANNVIDHSGVQGILLDATAGDLRGAMVTDNQVVNSYSFGSAGIHLVAPAGRTLQAEVRGNRCSDTQASKTQYFGVKETGAGTFLTRYLENDLSGNLDKAMGTVNATAPIEDNVGVATERQGVASIGVTAAVRVPHGLAFAPAAADVTTWVVTPPQSWITNQTGQVWVQEATAGDVALACSPPPAAGETVQVAWHAKVRGA